MWIDAGFKKEQLKVQVDNLGRLRISGERPLAGNQWSRFRMVLPIPEGCNVDGIRSRFEEDGVLHITMPRLWTAPAEEPNTGDAEMGGSDAGQDQNGGHSPAQPNAAAAAEAEEETWEVNVICHGNIKNQGFINAVVLIRGRL